MEATGKIGLGDQCVQLCIEADLIETLGSLDSDLIFIHSGKVYRPKPCSIII